MRICEGRQNCKNVAEGELMVLRFANQTWHVVFVLTKILRDNYLVCVHVHRSVYKYSHCLQKQQVEVMVVTASILQQLYKQGFP